MKLTIKKELQDKLPLFNVIAYTMDVDNLITEKVTNLLNETIDKYQNICELKDIVNYGKIKNARDGYKKLGKDPSHTRLACEALLRRVIKNKSLYRINDIVDLGNILSIMTQRSICVVDLDKVIGDVTIRIGTKKDIYETINRGILNVENIPLYTDDISFFGNPTSDTPRTMITETTKSILVMMICFDEEDLEKDREILIELYKNYANAENIKEVQYGRKL